MDNSIGRPLYHAATHADKAGLMPRRYSVIFIKCRETNIFMIAYYAATFLRYGSSTCRRDGPMFPFTLDV